MAKAKSFHKSLYFHDIDFKKIDVSSEIYAKKKFDSDKDMDFSTLNKILGHIIYFNDLEHDLLIS